MISDLLKYLTKFVSNTEISPQAEDSSADSGSSTLKNPETVQRSPSPAHLSSRTKVTGLLPPNSIQSQSTPKNDQASKSLLSQCSPKMLPTLSPLNSQNSPKTVQTHKSLQSQCTPSVVQTPSKSIHNQSTPNPDQFNPKTNKSNNSVGLTTPKSAHSRTAWAVVPLKIGKNNKCQLNILCRRWWRPESIELCDTCRYRHQYSGHCRTTLPDFNIERGGYQVLRIC